MSEDPEKKSIKDKVQKSGIEETKKDQLWKPWKSQFHRAIRNERNGLVGVVKDGKITQKV